MDKDGDGSVNFDEYLGKYVCVVCIHTRYIPLHKHIYLKFPLVYYFYSVMPLQLVSIRENIINYSLYNFVFTGAGGSSEDVAKDKDTVDALKDNFNKDLDKNHDGVLDKVSEVVINRRCCCS
jgi:hypothetical protein